MKHSVINGSFTMSHSQIVNSIKVSNMIVGIVFPLDLNAKKPI